eukprot:TRINITY_DN48925_c0_g1_i1.p1 TRINITY_DN48925_c0_g1~~TRINITY_DN48925_c0_g1_i1.p1  ORF type:complete len:416 (-),score=98.64 TRINITY_DN48925_c0_g1_i1:49-1209(-)
MEPDASCRQGCPAGCKASDEHEEENFDDEALRQLEAALTAPEAPLPGPSAEEEALYEDMFQTMFGSAPSSTPSAPSRTPALGSSAASATAVAGQERNGASTSMKRQAPEPEASDSKQPRLLAEEALVLGTTAHGKEPGDAAPLPEAALVLGTTAHGKEPGDAAPLPEAVASAYAVLDLPLTATAAEVKRRSRYLARTRHPDKVPLEERAQAARLFRQLQDAKDTVLAWLLDRDAAEKQSDESDAFDSDRECWDEAEKPHDVVFGEAGDIMAELESDGSGSDMERQDEKAIGLLRCRGDSPVTDADSDASEDPQAEAGLVLAGRHGIRTEDSAMVQASSLSHFLAAAPNSGRRQMCGECFVRPVVNEEKLCKLCKKELEELERRLRR